MRNQQYPIDTGNHNLDNQGNLVRITFQNDKNKASVVSKKQVIDGKTVYPIDIYGVGIITSPSAEEYDEMFQERLKQKYAEKQKTA